jgi:hypothetical protein
MSDISHDVRSASAPNAFYRAAWRWHFYAGLFVVPFLMILAVTGMMMMFIGYIDGRDGEKITVPVPQNGQMMSVSEQATPSPQASPKRGCCGVAQGARCTTTFLFFASKPTVFSRWSLSILTLETWLRAGTGARAGMTLLTASTAISCLEHRATAFWRLQPDCRSCWWLRDFTFGGRVTGPLSSPSCQTMKARGRDFWKGLHSSVGIFVSVFLLAFLITGMAWTGIWGSKIVQAWNTFPAEKWNNVPLSDSTHAAMNHGPGW